MNYQNFNVINSARDKLLSSDFLGLENLFQTTRASNGGAHYQALVDESLLTAAMHLKGLKLYRGVDFCLMYGADPNARGARGETALHWLAEQAEARTLDLLIHAGADPCAQDFYKATPLHVAIITTQENQAIDVLLSAGVRNCTSPGEMTNLQDTAGATPLHYAAQKGNLKQIKILLDHQASPNVKDHHSNTPLHVFSMRRPSDPEIVSRILTAMLERSADLAIENDQGDTSLHCMAKEGNLAGMRVLLAAGASANAKNHAGETPLSLVHRGFWRHLLPGKEYSECVDLLLRFGSDASMSDHQGKTVLHTLAAAGFPEYLEKILATGVNPNPVDDAKSRTPLHYAALNGGLESVEILLQHGAKPTLDAEGKTPGALAKQEGHTQVAELLRSIERQTFEEHSAQADDLSDSDLISPR